MDTIPNPSERAIRQQATAESFQRGRDDYRGGAVGAGWAGRATPTVLPGAKPIGRPICAACARHGRKYKLMDLVDEL